MAAKKKENEWSVMIIEDGILYFYYRNVDIGIPEAEQIVAERLAFTGSKDFPVFCDITANPRISTEAKKLLASEFGMKGTCGVALIVNTQMQALLGNAFIQLNKPKVPFRIFSNTEKAKTWLNTHVNLQT